MDDRQDSKAKVPVIGGSSMLVIFAVLCLVTFAMLDLATVQADRRLFDGMAEAARGYYEADFEANRVLAGLRDGIVPEGVSVEDDLYSWSVPASEGLMLECSARIGPGGAYETVMWALCPDSPWEGDFGLDVIDFG